jgi:hypothetical protein
MSNLAAYGGGGGADKKEDVVLYSHKAIVPKAPYYGKKMANKNANQADMSKYSFNQYNAGPPHT